MGEDQRKRAETRGTGAIAPAGSWKNARSINDWGYPYISESVPKKLSTKKTPPYERHFHYTHLDKVMEAVREWLIPLDAEVSAEVFEHHIKVALSDYFEGALDDTGLCGALMGACVQANRRRKS